MTDTKVLSAARVNEIFLDCLYQDGEDTSNHVAVQGIVLRVGFNPAKLELHKQEIHDMLAELPDNFRETGGGGWSFLQACEDRHGRQWTGEHRTMEQLVMLGVGTEQAQYLMPREIWSALPGGMPYFSVKQ